jgi:putative transposase
MIDPEHDLPIKQQAEVLGISRSSVYYQARPLSAEDLWLMRQIDELHLNYPFAGSRMLRDLLGHQGSEVGRRHIRTLMRRMGIEVVYRRPNTSRPAPRHTIYPYLPPRAGLEAVDHHGGLLLHRGTGRRSFQE